MSSPLPPTISSSAAARWACALPDASPWLHEEVARRMEERLQWMKLKPGKWVHWEPLRGGLQAHELLTTRYPKSECYVVHGIQEQDQAARRRMTPAWFSPVRWLGPALHFGKPLTPVGMLWANMALHMAADPQGLIVQWHQLLEADGFLMFSCLGPDTLREVRAVYAAQGWPPPSHAFTDMHDWGYMLVHAGFAEPVMDMEYITLTYEDARGVLHDLKRIGAHNATAGRGQGLMGKNAWSNLVENYERSRRDGKLPATYEVIYGHAWKPQPRVTADGAAIIRTPFKLT